MKYPFNSPSLFPVWSQARSAQLHGPTEAISGFRLKCTAAEPILPGCTRNNARRKMAEVSDQLRRNQCRSPRRSFLQNRSLREWEAEEQENSSWHWSYLITIKGYQERWWRKKTGETSFITQQKGLGEKGENNGSKWTPTTFSYIGTLRFFLRFHH